MNWEGSHCWVPVPADSVTDPKTVLLLRMR
jgi:hypothetical protein